MERIACIFLTFTIAGTFPLDHTQSGKDLVDYHPQNYNPFEHTPSDHHPIDNIRTDLHPIDHNQANDPPTVHTQLFNDPIDHTPPHQHPVEHHQHGHQDCHGQDCLLIHVAISNIGVYLDDHLCHVLVEINCNNHILTHDENICGSDGNTYANHCLFAKARCAQVLNHHNYYNGMLINPLVITKHGTCVLSTVPVITTTISASLDMSTNTTGSEATDTTVLSLHSVFGAVFCKNRWSINCGQNFTIVCGSDGNTYPNECELLKWQCVKPTLRKVSDSTLCMSP